jgi:expansin (peptidoglycan-binding protein)
LNLIETDHMSEEASGPASSDDEDLDTWNVRMRAVAEATGSEYSSGSFWEIIRPAWRSAAVSVLCFRWRRELIYFSS